MWSLQIYFNSDHTFGNPERTQKNSDSKFRFNIVEKNTPTLKFCLKKKPELVAKE